MSATIQQLVGMLAHIPPLAIFAFVGVWLALESCGLPLPNEIVLLVTGSLAAQGTVSPILLVVVATVASVAGATGAYEIGRRGGRAAVLRFGRYIRLDEQRLDGIERWFERAGPVAIGVSRITPFVRTVASFPAGMLRLSLRTFLIASTIGSLIWCAVMVSLGVVLGANYTVALKLIQRYTIPAVVVLIVLLAVYFWLHNKLSHVGEGPVGRHGVSTPEKPSATKKV